MDNKKVIFCRRRGVSIEMPQTEKTLSVACHKCKSHFIDKSEESTTTKKVVPRENRHKNKKIIWFSLAAIVLIVAAIIVIHTKNNRINSSQHSQIESAAKELYLPSPNILVSIDKSPSAEIVKLITDQVSVNVLAQARKTIRLRITAPNIEAFFADYLDANATFSDSIVETETLTSMLIHALSSGRLETVTNEVEVDYAIVDNQIRLTPNAEFYNAVYGGMIHTLDELNAFREESTR